MSCTGGLLHIKIAAHFDHQGLNARLGAEETVGHDRAAERNIDTNDEAAAERLARFGRCVILDAHSFPTGQLPTQVGFSAPLEIGVGTQPGHTSPELQALAEDFFRAHGFTVGVDIPFSGAIVPNRFFGTEPRVQSLMIEVRRDLYMEESTGERHDGFARIQAVLTEFRAELARFATT